MKRTNFGPDDPVGTIANYQLGDFQFTVTKLNDFEFEATNGEKRNVGTTPQKAVAKLFVDGATTDSIETDNTQLDVLSGTINFTATLHGLQVTVVQRTGDWMAYLNGDTTMWEAGNIPQEAIGKLVFNRAEELEQ